MGTCPRDAISPRPAEGSWAPGGVRLSLTLLNGSSTIRAGYVNYPLCVPEDGTLGYHPPASLQGDAGSSSPDARPGYERLR